MRYVFLRMEMHKVFYQGIKLKLFEPKQAVCMGFFFKGEGKQSIV